MSQNQDIQNNVELLKNRQDDLILRINNLEQENSEYKQQVTSLESQLDQLERKLCSASIEVRNIPKQEKESKNTLITILQNLGTDQTRLT